MQISIYNGRAVTDELLDGLDFPFDADGSPASGYFETGTAIDVPASFSGQIAASLSEVALTGRMVARGGEVALIRFDPVTARYRPFFAQMQAMRARGLPRELDQPLPKRYVEQDPVVARLFVEFLGLDATGNCVSVGTVLKLSWSGRWFDVFDPERGRDR